MTRFATRRRHLATPSMRCRLWALFLLLVLAPTLAVHATIGVQAQAAGQLVISSFGGAWGQAIQLGLIDSFERETGIDVILLPDQDVARSRAAIDSGNEPPEDMIDTNLATLFALNRDGYLAAIDYADFDQEVLATIPEYARADYAVGWGQFAVGLCYSKRAFPDGEPQPANWVDFWDQERFPGGRGMLAWPAEPVPEFALIADGVAVEELYPIDLDRAFAKMDEIRDTIPTFPDSPAVLGQQLVDGQVVMEACFTHRIQKLIDGGLDFITISYDQARLQTEYWGVWETAPNRDNAMRFIAYTLEAQPQAAWAQIGNTGPLNPDAFELIPDDVESNLPTAPSHTTLFVKDDNWYMETGADGKTNREVLEERWEEWLRS